MSLPSFNSNRRLLDLCEALRPFHPTFDSPELSKAYLHEAIFPGECYRAYRITNHLAYLRPLIESYLVWVELQQKPRQKEQLLLNALEDRDKSQLAASALKKRRKLLTENPLMDDEQYFHLYRTEEMSDRFFGAVNTRAKDDSLQKKQQQLDLYYISTKLKDACEMMNRQRIISDEYEYFMIEEILGKIRQGEIDLKAHPLIEIYYSILLTFKDFENSDHHDHLLALLQSHAKLIRTEELRGLYDYAKNYCIRKINTGQAQYLEKLFEVFKETIKTKVIYLDGTLSEWDYKNIVTVGTRLKEFEWTRQFIEEQAGFLEETRRENAYTYNLAVFYYALGDLDRTIELLRDVEFTDVSYNLGGRITLIKAYYDAEEHDPLLSSATSFKLFIKRSKLISPAQARVNLNLVRFTERLSRLRFKQPFTSKKTWAEAFSKLKKQIEAGPNIANKAWLMEKVEALKASA